jgi:hypothetical protein
MLGRPQLYAITNFVFGRAGAFERGILTQAQIRCIMVRFFLFRLSAQDRRIGGIPKSQPGNPARMP